MLKCPIWNKDKIQLFIMKTNKLINIEREVNKCLKKFSISELTPLQEYEECIKKMNPLEIVDFSTLLETELTKEIIEDIHRNYIENGAPHSYKINEKSQYIDNYALADLTLASLWIEDRITNLKEINYVFKNYIFLYNKVINGEVIIRKKKKEPAHIQTFSINEKFRSDNYKNIVTLFFELRKLKYNKKPLIEGEAKYFIEMFSNKTVQSTKKPKLNWNGTSTEFAYFFEYVFDYIVLYSKTKKHNITKYDILNHYFTVNKESLFNPKGNSENIRRTFSNVRSKVNDNKNIALNKNLNINPICKHQKEIDLILKELDILQAQ